MNRWPSVALAIIVLLSFGGIYSGFMTYVLGRFIYGRLWHSVRFALPKMQFRVAEFLALFLVLQTTLALTQVIWPVIERTQCVLVRLPQSVEVQISSVTAAAPRHTATQFANLEMANRMLSAAIPCGIAMFSWLLGNLVIQANRLTSTLDRLLVLLFVAPLGTLCGVLIPTLSAIYLVVLVTPGGNLPRIDSAIWHGLVLFAGGLLGIIYCRAVGGWIVRRAAHAGTVKIVSNLKTT